MYNHLAATLDNMRAAGVKILYGRWLIEGAPNVLLFDTGSQYSRLDEWKGDLWNLAGIPTPPSDHETNETIIFGYIVAWFLGEVRNLRHISRNPFPLPLAAEASSRIPRRRLSSEITRAASRTYANI